MGFPRTVLCMLALAAALSACSHTSDWYALRDLDERFSDQMHDCVPLGWNPARVDDRFFYSGFSSELDETFWYLPPPWVAMIRPQDRAHPQARAAEALLDHLARAGMVARSRSHGSTDYNLTLSGLDYFFDANHFGNNPLHEPYLCYSKIVPERVLWKQAVHSERDSSGAGTVQVYRVAFVWTAVPVGNWSPDAFVRSHGVVLGPSVDPTIAKFVLRDTHWYLESIYAAQRDRVVDPSVWPSPGI